MISPGEPISRSRWITGSNMARPAPPADRARMTCNPTSRACGRNSASASSGFAAPANPAAPAAPAAPPARRPHRPSHQVVIVDHDEQVGPAPPRPGTKLSRGQVRRRQPAAQHPAHLVQQRGRRHRGRGVADLVRYLGRVQQRAPVIEEDDPGLLRGVACGNARDGQPQQVRLAALGVAEDQEVRVGREVQEHRGQLALVDAERHPRPGRAAAAASAAAAGSTSGSIRTGGAPPPSQAAATWPTSARTASGSPAAVGARRSAASRPGSAARPGSGRGRARRPARSGAAARPISDSYGSPSRSSSRVPNRSRTAGRISDHLLVAATTWTP